MKDKVKLPIGIENFEKIRTEGFYYVDKTGLIRELLDNWGEVNLFARPRRFGKSLNMNMLRCFFECGCRSELFEGLEISRATDYCEKYMGRFPVISITLKGVSAMDFLGAKAMLRTVIGNEAMRFLFLKESPRLSEDEKESYRQLAALDSAGRQKFSMSDDMLADSFYTLSKLLRKHYGQKVILLIDEYDVPLDKARHCGYYDEMVTLIRNLFGTALKTNDSLQFAVLTGCLRIAKESIFTGLNNLNVFSVTDVRFASRFGFTSEDVRQLLGYYHLEDKFETIRKWYDGYRFGNTEVYCPWDVINYVDLLRTEPAAFPRAYWINTSGNDIIRKFIRMATPSTRREIEALVAGETVTHRIRQELTYRELYDNIDNLWSVLFTTGYLTQRGSGADAADVYRHHPEPGDPADIRGTDTGVVPGGGTEGCAQAGRFLRRISPGGCRGGRKAVQRLSAQDHQHPRYSRENRKEGELLSVPPWLSNVTVYVSVSHGILLGLLAHREDWVVASNVESGDGYSDILVELEEDGLGIVIEVKYAENGNFEKGCREAMAQIDDMGYVASLLEDGMERILKYGIACHKKKCMVQVAGFPPSAMV